MRNFIQGFKAKREGRKNKGKIALSVLGGTAALAALAPAAGAAPITFTGVTTGVAVEDAVATGVNFLGIFGEYTTLAIGAIIAAAILSFTFLVVRKIRVGNKN